MGTHLAARRAEFARFIWDHSVDEFQATFDTCTPLSKAELAWFEDCLTPTNLRTREALVKGLDAAIATDNEKAIRLLQLVGLTRSKLLQDVKAGARAAHRKLPVSSTSALFRSDEGRRIVASRLADRVLKVFGGFKTDIPATVLEALNQATWPGFIRQARAKRQGHEAERRLAALLTLCGLPFEPKEKATNPLCPDAQVDGVSYDVVSPSVASPLLRIKSTVHTAVIGQYGESKDDLEISQAASSIRKSPGAKDTTLMALVDGVGLESNRAGLDGVLTHADEFCQFRTIWKVAVVAAAKAERRITVMLPLDQHALFAPFTRRYGATLVKSPRHAPQPEGWIPAGEGWLRMG